MRCDATDSDGDRKDVFEFEWPLGNVSVLFLDGGNNVLSVCMCVCLLAGSFGGTNGNYSNSLTFISLPVLETESRG